MNATRCNEDEMLIDLVQKWTPGGQPLMIFDARPKMNALGNKLAGKGFEDTSYYRNCRLLLLMLYSTG